MISAGIVNIGLGFIEGFALIVSPCILPILPIILSGSLTGSKRRPIGIVIGFVLVFALFTFFSRKLVVYSGIDANVIRYLAYGLLTLFGVIMMSSYLTEKFNWLTQSFSSVGSNLSVVNNPQGGLISGILFGGLVAIIWTPCAGPILAAIIVQIVIQKTTLMSFLTILAFGLGAVLPMFAIVIAGRSVISKFHFFKKHAVLFRKILGFIILLSVIYMLYMGSDIAPAKQVPENHTQTFGLQNELSEPYPAPAIAGIGAWINTAPLQLDQLKGKVILIDFWTYSCINCIRTLPYLKDWYHKYHHQGLIIIGIHTPEFDFEKNLNNVKNAVLQDKIEYPVALDNNFVTWQKFNNSYWPAHYLIDKNGNVVYTHFGEGEYDVTENNIRFLLGIKQAASATEENAQGLGQATTPETYLGYARAEQFSSPEAVKRDQPGNYTFPSKLSINQWALQGNWRIMSDRIVATEANAAIEINFYARNVFIVMGSANDQNIEVQLSYGNDKNEKITVNQHKLYQAISLDHASIGILRVTALSKGLEIYTFTFG